MGPIEGVADKDLAPTAHVLNSIANDNLSWKLAIGELIDNAIDAEAKQITIVVGPNRRSGIPEFFSVKDDGKGCEDITSMVQIGRHDAHDASIMGRFGIGAKNAMLWIGGTESRSRIVTHRKGRKQKLDLPWKQFGESRSQLDLSRSIRA
jgi:anti-sigma regulatory factor (Ser/Thr protein kinase)